MIPPQKKPSSDAWILWSTCQDSLSSTEIKKTLPHIPPSQRSCSALSLEHFQHHFMTTDKKQWRSAPPHPHMHLFKTLFFQRNFKLITKFSKGYQDFPYTSCLIPCIASPVTNIPLPPEKGFIC